MRVKIGNIWHEATVEAPICLELNPQDKKNIGSMLDSAQLFAEFHDDDRMTRDEMMDWMHEGSIVEREV